MVKCLPVRVRTQTGVIGKIHLDKEVQVVYKLKVSFENQHSNIPSFPGPDLAVYGKTSELRF